MQVNYSGGVFLPYFSALDSTVSCGEMECNSLQGLNTFENALSATNSAYAHTKNRYC